MKVNRSKLAQLKQRWELLKMKSAYIAAEQQIIAESDNGMADGIATLHTSWATPEDAQMWEMDETGRLQQLTIKEIQIKKLEQQLEELQKQGDKLLEDEKYELMQEVKELYDIISHQLRKLRSDR